jgi:hypothetical protein
VNVADERQQARTQTQQTMASVRISLMLNYDLITAMVWQRCAQTLWTMCRSAQIGARLDRHKVEKINPAQNTKNKKGNLTNLLAQRSDAGAGWIEASGLFARFFSFAWQAIPAMSPQTP